MNCCQNDNTASVLNNLLSAYMLGYNVISDMQNQSLQTSAGNATTTANNSASSSAAQTAGQAVNILSKVLGLLGK